MKKITNPSTKNKKTTLKRGDEDIKVSKWLEDYMDCFTFTYKPVTEAFINRISEELVQWARTDEKAYKIRPFFSNKGIAMDTYYTWRDKYPVFAHAYKVALSIIGDRRERGALERKLDAGIVTFMAHHYDAEWKSAREYHNSLKKEAQGDSNVPINVYLEKFPSSDIVPEKDIDISSKSPEEVAAQMSLKGKTPAKLNK